MGYRRARMVRESFENQVILDNGGESIVAPSDLTIAMEEQIDATVDFNKQVENVIAIEDDIAIAEGDVDTLTSMEESLEDESREVSDEEAETIVMQVEFFAKRYGFDLPRELGTESFGTSPKNNRALALKYVGAAKLETENFITDAARSAKEGIAKAWKSYTTTTGALRRYSEAAEKQRVSNKTAPGTINGETTYTQINQQLTLAGKFIGADIEKLRAFAKLNADYKPNYINDVEGLFNDLVAAAKDGKLADIKEVTDIIPIVPSFDAIIKKIDADVDGFTRDSDGAVEGLSGRKWFRLDKKTVVKSYALCLIPYVGGHLSAAYDEIQYGKLAAPIPCLSGPTLDAHNAFLKELADMLDGSAIFTMINGKESSGMDMKPYTAQLKALSDLDLPKGTHKLIEKAVLLAATAISGQVNMRLSNLDNMANGLMEYTQASLAAHK